jgi:hypothetical protein
VIKEYFHQDVSNLPYQERQLITIVADALVKEAEKKIEVEEKKEEKTTEEVKGEVTFSDLTSELYKMVVKTNAVLLTGEVLGTVAVQAFESWKKSRTSGIVIQPISIRQTSGLVFPPGHPKYGVVYVAHPTKMNVYFPMSGFHRFVFEDKFREALDILMALGASNIKVEHISGWSGDISAAAELKVPTKVDTVSAFGGVEINQSSNLMFEANLSGHQTPELPEDLNWYHHEPTWQSIALGRKKYGLKDFVLNVTYLDDLGVNAALKAEVLKVGLGIGGNFQDHRSTIWRLRGEFSSNGVKA